MPPRQPEAEFGLVACSLADDASGLRRRLNEQRLRKDTKPAGCMKVAARQHPNALDHFTSTIAPCGSLRVAAVLTIKHAVLLVGFTVATMALMRQLLAG